RVPTASQQCNYAKTPEQRCHSRNRRHREAVEENLGGKRIAEQSPVVCKRVCGGQRLRGPRTFLRKTDKEECGYRQYQNDGEHYGRSRGERTCFATRDCRASAWRAFHRRCCKPSG